MPHVKKLLLDQFLANANDPSWYLPFTEAVENLSEEEAFWKPTENSHSIAEIIQHLIYWNETWQIRFKKANVLAVTPIENNDESFVIPKNRKFTELREQLEVVLLQWQNLLTEEQLESDVVGFSLSAKWYEVLGNAITHNAYHIGQIVYIRKLQENRDTRGRL
ncbi:DinB family protein [Ornithinibacillus bavariensis]|uniref:DinB family protein n=1 Tax=Ornithinibacillus bavariensis TaxID=545502 RepID=UPI003D247F1C